MKLFLSIIKTKHCLVNSVWYTNPVDGVGRVFKKGDCRGHLESFQQNRDHFNATAKGAHLKEMNDEALLSYLDELLAKEV